MRVCRLFADRSFIQGDRKHAAIRHDDLPCCGSLAKGSQSAQRDPDDPGLTFLGSLEWIDQTWRARFDQGLSMRFAIVILGLLFHPLLGVDGVEERREDGEVMAAFVTEDAASFDSSHSVILLGKSSQPSAVSFFMVAEHRHAT